MAQDRTADGLHVQPGRQQKAEPENPRACDVHRQVGGEHRAVFTERKRILRFDPNVRLHRRGLQGGGPLDVRVTEGAAHRESGDLRLERLRHRAWKILEVDRRKRVRAHGVELHFVARGHAQQTDLAGGVGDGHQPERLLERQRPRGDLRAHEERERPRLRRVQAHPQLARVGIETPQRHQGFRISDFGFRICR